MKKKTVKYLIKVFAHSIVAALVIKFIPLRLTKPLPTWGELLCFFPVILIIMVIALFVGELKKKSNHS